MLFEDLRPKITNLKYTHDGAVEEIYNLVREKGFSSILELGTAFGKTTAAIAAALQENGGGFVETVDLHVVEERFHKNSCKTVINDLGLAEFTIINHENHSYNWYLKKQIETQLKAGKIEPKYDFVFLDGAHNFTIDGLAFHLCDRLLKPGGVILFDDLKYNIFDLNEAQGTSNEFTLDSFDPRARVVRTPMGEDELKACHVGLIYELMVKTHPGYGDFKYSNNQNWGYATKLGS